MGIIELCLKVGYFTRHHFPDTPNRRDHDRHRQNKVVDFGLFPEVTLLVERVLKGHHGLADVDIEEREGQNAMVTVDELL